MKIRYQIFLSSTFKDLEAERKKVFDVLMKMNCIPAGMELFPAADDEQFEFIKKVIDDCDYYVLIIGGRYGTVSDDGISFTQKEYEYAVSKGIKVLSFLHAEPERIEVGKSDIAPELANKLKAFRTLVSKGRLVQFWGSPDELASKVILSLQNAISTYPAFGWVRGDNVPSEGATQEILKLKDEIEKLRNSAIINRTTAPEGTDDLLQGTDKLLLKYSIRATSEDSFAYDSDEVNSEARSCSLEMNFLFGRISPNLIDECTTDAFYHRVNELVKEVAEFEIDKWVKSNDTRTQTHTFNHIFLARESEETVLVQFRALGLIQKSERNRSIKDKHTYWTLTPYGDNLMNRLRAIKRQ